MRIDRVEFAGVVARVGGAAPGDLPQIAFSGRSNVGKSSLINRLLGRTRTPVARVSSTPGKTQEIHFYRVRGNRAEAGARAREDLEFYLVDLPGYGYARAPVAVKDAWKPLIERYLASNDRLSGVLHLIDARHDPTEGDLRMLEYLASLGVPALFVLTKVDKLKASVRGTQIARSTELLGVGPEQVVPFSAKTGEGREQLLDSLVALLEEPGA